ncbi:molybdopterin-binding protein [Granulicella aggregans]|jgi:hypothetical protein|uniref:hypothetical protein n=1 Tax=Granulicella aggregans TaxID=474949 RepID=UPI0021E06299|nr:hypothetical protein [Granulicella aggregans]
MKISGLFRSRNAVLTLALFCSALSVAPAQAQDATGNKPEMMAPADSQMHSAKPKAPSTALTLTLGDKTLTLSPADVAAMPHETVTVVNGHTKASETYSGVPIAAILTKLGLPFEKANEHTLLKTYVVAEGTDGYRSLVSTYETLSTIRGTSVIVADTLAGKPLDKDGIFKLVIPGDTRPQRWVQNLKSLTFKTID